MLVIAGLGSLRLSETGRRNAQLDQDALLMAASPIWSCLDDCFNIVARCGAPHLVLFRVPQLAACCEQAHQQLKEELGLGHFEG
jgi:hypothetical protein